MSNFPNQIDDDTTLPPVNDNITEIGEEAINAVRDAVFNIENNIGIGAAGTVGSIANRLNQALNPDGTIRASAFSSLDPAVITAISQALVVTDSQILPASISENKINLAYTTSALYGYTQDNARSTNIALGWIDTSGVKLEPHLAGQLYRHTLDEIDVPLSLGYLKNRFGLYRNNTNSYTVLSDLNSDFVAHQLSDGTVPGSSPNVTTPSGIVYPSSFAHSGTGIYIDPSIFAIIPQTVDNIQLLAEYIDSANILLLGTKTQTLFQSGIPRASRSTVIGSNSKGPEVVPATPATTFLSTTIPQDSAFPPYGDDIILFNNSSVSAATFQSYLNSVNVGDVATVNYGTVVATFLIKEVNSYESTIRIAGKNLVGTIGATATVDISRALDNFNKYGVLAPSVSNSPSVGLPSSLVIGSPRGAQTTGIGFNPSLFDSTHYNLYLILYPNGNPSSSSVNLVAVDVTGNQGATPGSYTLDTIVQSTNAVFRKAGFNFRFIAFEYEGEFGIMLADSYDATSFSVVAGVLGGISGSYEQSLSTTVYPNNVVDIFNLIDPLGFGPDGNNVASPPFSGAGFTTSAASLFPTVLLNPLQRNFYYVNGAESDRFAVEPSQLLDVNGDSYWPASIVSKSITGSTVQVTYQVNDNLTSSNLQPGKTLVVQPAVAGTGLPTDFGRFIIQNVNFVSTCTSDGYVYSTTITVYDAVHGVGSSPYVTSGIGLAVNLYFGQDSVSFNSENSTDILGQTNTFPFKRHFEVYIDQNGSTYSYERARLSLNTTAVNLNPTLSHPLGMVNDVQFFVGNGNDLNNFNIVEVSPKLTGYNFTNGAEGITVTKINLQLINYNSTTGTYQGYLRRYDAIDGETFAGPVTTGKNGEITRFYDSTFVDYIDLELDFGGVVSVGDGYGMDIQIFPSLRGRDDILLLATCQYNDSSNQISWLKDKRQFGNISEEELSDSALNFIGSTARYTQQNGVVRGFDYLSTTNNFVAFRGGLALVNGSFLAINPFELEVPIVQDAAGGSPSGVLFAACVNSNGETILIPLTDYNAAINSINNPGRLVSLNNLVSTLTYAVDSSTFSTVINDRKDLTIFYLVSIVATSSTAYTIAVLDARKYVTDNSGNTPMVITDGDSQGNFKTFGAVNTWSMYNGSYQNNVVVRTDIVLTADPGFASGLIFSGDGANSGLTFNTAASYTLTDLTFNNMTLNVNVPVTVVGCTFNNCVINVGALGSIDPSTFNGCTINLVQPLDLIAATLKECNINVGYSGLTNTATTLATGLIVNPSANGVILQECSITYYPNTSSGYSASNLINSGFGAIYCNVNAVQNVMIDKCTFTTSTSTRFSFISFEYSSNTSIAQSVYITNNKFYNTSTSDDMNAVIAFTSTQTTSQPTEGLKLIDCNISNNACDKSQLISVSATRDGTNTINCAIVPVGLNISKNLCGTISVVGAIDNERNYNTSSSGFGYDKSNGAVISGNTCRYIGMLDATGVAVLYYSFFIGSHSILVNTCPISVIGNSCSWIQFAPNQLTTSIPYQQNSCMLIADNSLKAYNVAYLQTFSPTLIDTLNAGIVLEPGNPTIPSVPSAIIRGNKIVQGSSLTNVSTTVVYDYVNSINLGINAIIDSNFFSNIATTGGPYDMIYVFTNSVPVLNIAISNNQFYRNNNTIRTYVYINSENATQGVITSNFFDSTTVDGTNTSLIFGISTDNVVANNVNFNYSTGVYTYPANSTSTYGANSTLTFGAGTKIVSATPLTKNLVQPLLVLGSSGASLNSFAPHLPAGGPNSNYVYIQLSNLINGNTPTSVNCTLGLVGTANGDGLFYLIRLNINDGSTTTYTQYDMVEPHSATPVVAAYPWSGNLIPAIDTANYEYFMFFGSDSGCITNIYSITMVFGGYTQLLPIP